MSHGYVYILINRSFPELIKVGRTLRDSSARARELFTTGVPTPFQVAFEMYSERHEELEAAIHEELRDFRVAERREFFRFPLDKAISRLQALNRTPTEPSARFVAEDITERLRAQYPRYLRPEIAAVRIVQVPERVWLEITEETEVAGYLKDQIIRRSDLAFISDDETPFFNPQDDIQINVRKFVEEFDVYGIMMTTSLFHEAACEEINRLHNPLARRPESGSL